MKLFGSFVVIAALFFAVCQGEDTGKDDKDTGLYNRDYGYGYNNRYGNLGYNGYNGYNGRGYGYGGYGYNPNGYGYGYGTNGYGTTGYGVNGYGRSGYY
ncbi:keratin-associated protein 19-2-like [Microplitis demolitor]|uniref:keratin-associated protein 19-2-like n=1 Tax=Microplitis demolitor TaxID=69319 RepID=UPI00235B61D8|nr:keratin-associated protein 19-2-like [Microplitis demolitor]